MLIILYLRTIRCRRGNLALQTSRSHQRFAGSFRCQTATYKMRATLYSSRESCFHHHNTGLHAHSSRVDRSERPPSTQTCSPPAVAVPPQTGTTRPDGPTVSLTRCEILNTHRPIAIFGALQGPERSIRTWFPRGGWSGKTDKGAGIGGERHGLGYYASGARRG